MSLLKKTGQAVIFSMAFLSPTYLCNQETIQAKLDTARPSKPKTELNSLDGTIYSLNYTLLNCKNMPEAMEAVDSIGKLPMHYRRILQLEGTKILVAATDSDLPKAQKEAHDHSLALYKKELGTEKLCGLQMSNKTTVAINPTTVTLLHCDSPAHYTLHELGHAFDVSAPHLFNLGFNQISAMPRFQSIYCGKLKENNPKTDCDKRMPNGCPEYREFFADAFARYYVSDEENKTLQKYHPELHEYFYILEARILQKMIELKW